LYQFVRHKSLMDWPEIEPEPARREAGDWQPEPWHGQTLAVQVISYRTYYMNSTPT
jgi:hypothetical protein